MNKDKVLCIYHSRDLDGWTSAAIVNDSYPNAELIGWDYGDPVPDVDWHDYQWVFLVDISFDPKTMKGLPSHVIWIDHHVSAIKDAKENGYDGMNGLRNTEYAACELTWEYTHEGDMPEAIRLLGLYDSFSHMKLDKREQNRVTYFQYAARASVDNPIDAQMFMDLSHDEINDWIVNGLAIHRYLTTEAQASIKEAFQVTILGKKGRLVNATRLNPKNFGIDIPDGEFFGAFHYTGERWVTSLYSDTVDCSVICKELGGGGHPGAAGFQRDEFENLEQIFNS